MQLFLEAFLLLANWILIVTLACPLVISPYLIVLPVTCMSSLPMPLWLLQRHPCLLWVVDQANIIPPYWFPIAAFKSDSFYLCINFLCHYFHPSLPHRTFTQQTTLLTCIDPPLAAFTLLLPLRSQTRGKALTWNANGPFPSTLAILNV